MEVGHAVAVRVSHGAVHAAGGQRVETVLPLPTVGQAVVVGVGVVWLRVHEVLQPVGQPVAVLIGGGLDVHSGVLDGGQGGGEHQHREHQRFERFFALGECWSNRGRRGIRACQHGSHAIGCV